MTDMLINQEGLTAAANNFMQHAQGIEERIHAVQSVLSELQGNWKGSAILQVDELLQRWNTEATNIQMLLQETSSRISRANVSYGELEADIARSFQ